MVGTMRRQRGGHTLNPWPRGGTEPFGPGQPSRRTLFFRESSQWIIIKKEIALKWETPPAFAIRFGFEITMYISNR